MIKVDTRGVEQTVRELKDMPRRLQFAAVQALTRTALAVRDAEQREMRDVFDRPTPFTLNALFVEPATMAKPVARVGIKDNVGGARPATSWLRWQVFGGLRTPKAFERLLMQAGAMRSDDRAVPGRFARLDAYGNWSRGQLIQVLSQLRIESSSGSSRSLPRFSFDDRGQDRRRKQGVIKRAYQRAGGQFVAFPNGRGRLLPGIYMVRDTAFGRTDPKPVLLFVSKAEYEAGRFDFPFVARKAIERNLQPELQRAMQQVLQRRVGAA